MEKQRKQAYLEACQAEVAADNASLAATIEELDGLLRATLERDDHIDLQRLKRSAQHPPFRPGQDAEPLPAPRDVVVPAEPAWSQFAPPEPTGMAKAFGGRRRHEAQVAQARTRFDTAHVPILLHGEEAVTWPILEYAKRNDYDQRIGFEDTLKGPEDVWLATGNEELVRFALGQNPPRRHAQRQRRGASDHATTGPVTAVEPSPSLCLPCCTCLPGELVCRR